MVGQLIGKRFFFGWLGAVVIPNPIGNRNAISFKIPACAGMTTFLFYAENKICVFCVISGNKNINGTNY